MARHSVDGLITNVEGQAIEDNAQASVKPAANDPKPTVKENLTDEKEIPESKAEQETETEQDPYLSEKPVVDNETNTQESKPNQESTDDTEPLDEYGTPVQKPRLYTEEELQQRIRDRLRDRFEATNQTNQNVNQQQFQQQAAQDGGFKYDQNSSETWEQQLEIFVERTMQKVSQKQAQAQWEAQENVKQAKFEEKFTHGMSKYRDFKETVSPRKITNAMLQATKALDNPAAFIYAASKLHPQELDRIGSIQDSSQQMVEIGRLEERMKKAKAVTQAKKPIKTPAGDIPDKASGKRNIDDLIRHDANRELKARGRR